MLELNKIYNMDCLEGMKLIPDNSIDLIITSPPYNIGIDYDSWDDRMKWNDYLLWIEKWLVECYRILKSDGKICINHYINFRDLSKIDRFPLMDIRNIQEKIGYNVNKLVIWEDRTYANITAWGSYKSASSPHIQTPYEGILISHKKQWKKTKSGVSTISKNDFIKGVSGIWRIQPEINQRTKACFPIKIPQLCIELLTYKGDNILDPFMGSGTTAVACKQSQRNFIGFEISKKYCDIANKRLQQSNLFSFQEGLL